MAQLGVAGAGAVVGGVIGTFLGGQTVLGAQIGWALGGIAGALLFPPKGADQNGPRLNDLSVQTSGYGVPIPVVAGRSKLAGNVIWKTDLRETVNRRRQGKGGGGTRVTTYTYSMSWAVGLCEWLIPPTQSEILRIWLDAKLVYDVSGASAVTQIPGLTWRYYPGSEDQFPDPLISAREGADAPAHRGLAYIVFDDVPLAEFGNRMPNVTVELVADATRTFPQTNTTAPAVTLFPSSPGGSLYTNWEMGVAVDYARGRVYEGRQRSSGADGPDDYLIRVYDMVTMAGIAEYSVDQIVEPVMGGTTASASVSPGLLHLGADGFLYMTGTRNSSSGVRSALWKIDPDSMRAVSYFGPRTGNSYFLSSSEAHLTSAMSMTSIQVPRLGTTPRTFVIVSCYRSALYTIDADNVTGGTMEYVWGAVDISVAPAAVNNGYPFIPSVFLHAVVAGQQREEGTDVFHVLARYDSTPYRVEITRVTYTSGAANLGAGAAMGITRHATVSVDIQAQVDASATRTVLHGAWWDESDNTLVITTSGGGSPGTSWTRFSTWKVNIDGDVVWAVVNHAMPSNNDARGDMRRVLGGLWGQGGGPVLFPATGDILVSPAGGTFNTLAWVDEQQAVVGFVSTGVGSREIAKRMVNRASPDNLVVGDIVEALCERAGLEAADLNVSALTDSIRGYTLPRPMSARDAITPLAAAYQFDAVEQDDILLFRKRAGSVVATVAYDDMVRESPDATVIEEQRAQDADLPRELTVRYADVERDYEQNAQSWRRPAAPVAVTGANASAGFDLPIPLTSGEAKAVAKRALVSTWRERTRVAFSVGPQSARLVPTDPIMITTRDGASIRCRVLSTQLGGNWVTRVEAVTEDAATYALTADADGGAAYQAAVMPAPYFARLLVPDLALVQDADDTALSGLREYAAVGAYDGQNYRGVDIFRSADAAVWTRLDRAVSSVTWGAVAAISGQPGTPWTWDEVNTIDITLLDGDVESATALEVLNGANLAALIGGDGAAELIQFRDATALGGTAYRLSGLLRGRRGTEDLIATRAAGDGFLLIGDEVLRFEATASEAAATRFHRAVTIYDTVETAPATVTKTARGRAERPYAPAHVAGARDGSDNLTITWLRRTRVGGEWLDGTGTVSLSEASEAYEVDVMDGAAVVRTIDGLSSATASYSAADQTADFGSPQASVAVRVYQISAQVGRGIAAEAVV